MEKKLNFVIECLRERVANSGLNLNVYDEDETDVQVSFNETNNIPLYGDVLGILTCFFTNPHDIIKIERSWGFTEIYLSDGKWKSEISKKEVNLFLPKKR